jgi:hypothetical protein
VAFQVTAIDFDVERGSAATVAPLIFLRNTSLPHLKSFRAQRSSDEASHLGPFLQFLIQRVRLTFLPSLDTLYLIESAEIPCLFVSPSKVKEAFRIDFKSLLKVEFKASSSSLGTGQTFISIGHRKSLAEVPKASSKV